jgi:hypothetical protein
MLHYVVRIFVEGNVAMSGRSFAYWTHRTGHSAGGALCSRWLQVEVAEVQP